MRKNIAIVLSASAVLLGAAQAAPTFGASSHHLGGERAGKYATQETETATFLEVFLGVLTFDLSAKATPIAERRTVDEKARAAECEQAKKDNAEIAQAEPETNGDKAKHPNLEPMFLAF
jgi:hypothetical protein